jgi:hypothetical protein
MVVQLQHAMPPLVSLMHVPILCMVESPLKVLSLMGEA